MQRRMFGTIEAFYATLSEDQRVRLIRKLWSHCQDWPRGPAEMMAAGLAEEPDRQPLSQEQALLLDAHYEAIGAVNAARLRQQEAFSDLQKAKANPASVNPATGTISRTEAQRQAVALAQDAFEEVWREFDAACEREKQAWRAMNGIPEPKTGRTGGIKFPLSGIVRKVVGQ